MPVKAYQIIYTCAQHSISDTELDFSDKPGYGVYSFSEGLTKEEINEVIKYSNYRLPSLCSPEAAANPDDGSNADKYPVVFRTLKLSGGRYAAIQSVFAGNDINGEPKNFLSHALVFDTEGGEPPALYEYYGSPVFRKCLTELERNAPKVNYLPVIDSPAKNKELEERLKAFTDGHKCELTYLFEKLLNVLASADKNHLMLCSADTDTVIMYMLSLKRLLPKKLSDSFGISTYNVNIPSDKQKRIKLHGTKKDFNNITENAVESHTGCVYIELDGLDMSETEPMKLFDYSDAERLELYSEYNFEFAQQIGSWLKSYKQSMIPEIAVILGEMRDNCGTGLYTKRCREIFAEIDSPLYADVKFEILDSICANIRLFEEYKNDIVIKYMIEGFSSICSGEAINLENAIKTEGCIEAIYSQLDKYMEAVKGGRIDTGNGMLLLRNFALIKQEMKLPTWKEFFNHNDDYISEFVEIAALVIINDTSPLTFTSPVIWTNEELAEVIAYFDSSTEDAALRRGCRKFIMANSEIKWGIYGITLQKVKKSRDETELDIQRIRAMLSQAGYTPFSKTGYQDLKFQVINDMNSSDNPLLLTRLLYAFYAWQATDGQLNEARQAAERVSDLIMELKETERSCYDYVFPKLGLEILDTNGHFHELMVNADTMTPEFWNWFLLSYMKNEENEERRFVYQRVFEASEPYMKDVPVQSKIRRVINNR